MFIGWQKTYCTVAVTKNWGTFIKHLQQVVDNNLITTHHSWNFQTLIVYCNVTWLNGYHQSNRFRQSYIVCLPCVANVIKRDAYVSYCLLYKHLGFNLYLSLMNYQYAQWERQSFLYIVIMNYCQNNEDEFKHSKHKLRVWKGMTIRGSSQ